MNVPFLDLAAMHAGLWPELDQIWHLASRSGSFIGGELVERFETLWASYCGTRHCVGVDNGTSAIELTLAALGIGRGDEVIVPTNTFIATAEAVVATGARPVFVDVDPTTLLMTAETVAAAISPRTAAVIAVHLYGQPVDMDAIHRVADPAGIVVIEDAAQAHGARWQGRRTGSLSKAGCFSFYPGKNLGAFGDAGAIVTDDAALAERVRVMSNHGRPRNAPHRHEPGGTNHRLDALQAGILAVKLKHLDAWNASRAQAARHYAAVLADLPLELVTIDPRAVSSHHLMVVLTEQRDELRRKLSMAGVATGIHYPIPCHCQPAFAAEKHPPLPTAERAAGRLLSLPMFPQLTEVQIDYVANALRLALDEAVPLRPSLASYRFERGQVPKQLPEIHPRQGSRQVLTGDSL
ncbi:DegT/DnrJ/EryC1/StrS family aminotransferase [Benzoatithermus flavus]|uniref:DegT/DnrJ/EryC1/StrS family aminotransferase n=1 Tax=Benzoatithermus flavus TaxID=3108223 RepID=A0ABU8XKM2_9PROT